jgi:predicted nucleic acid-binding protein
VTKAELLFGIERLVDGKRKAALTLLVSAILERFGERVLPFAEADATSYARIVADRMRMARPILPFDAQIAAIAASRNAAVATRDGGFEGCGVELINPWSA